MNAEPGASAAPTDSQTLLISFGVAGNSAEFVAGGWSVAERNFRWMTGMESHLLIEPGLFGDHIIELDLHPLLSLPALPTQRLTVSVNDRVIGQSKIAHDGRVGYRIPAEALAGRHSTSIVFTHPDGARPCDILRSKDQRKLSMSVKRLKVSRTRAGQASGLARGTGGIEPAELERLVGLAPARFILNFESLGDNCEFALVQRCCGAEAFFSLLRFAGMELPTLLRALDSGLQDFGNPANVEIRPDDKPRPEFVVHELRYGAFFHTFRYQDETDAALLHASESNRIAYCAQRFVGDLKRGSKIFVVKRNDPLREDEILPLYAALSSFGRNVLLWMVPADADHPSGTVEVVMPGLFKGFIERFAPYDNAPDILLGAWLEVCANAYRFWLADRPGPDFPRDTETNGELQEPESLGMQAPQNLDMQGPRNLGNGQQMGGSGHET